MSGVSNLLAALGQYPVSPDAAGASNSETRPWWANLLVATGMFALNGLTNTLNAGNIGNPYSAPTANFNIVNLLLIGGIIYFISKKK